MALADYIFHRPVIDNERLTIRSMCAGDIPALTLTVNVSSPDLKADTVFVHEVTIRQVGENAFQYISNRIISQAEYGMPNKTPRLSYRN